MLVCGLRLWRFLLIIDCLRASSFDFCKSLVPKIFLKHAAKLSSETLSLYFGLGL